MTKTIQGWAVLEPVERELVPYGNGKQFQYPLFRSLREAKNWKKEWPELRGKIVRCQIRIEGKG